MPIRRALRRILPLVSVSLLLASAGCSDRAVVEESGGPVSRNLLLITVDTLRADHLGTYGGRDGVSPVIDRLAADGVVFERAYAPMGQTLPSMASMFTSKAPDETGLHGNRQSLSEDELLLAERLERGGFRCRGVTASWVLRPGGGRIDQGFEEYQLIRDERALTDAAIEMLRRGFGQNGRREFLWLHYMDPHQPYEAREPYASQFLGETGGLIQDGVDILESVYEDDKKLTPDELRTVKGVYDSQVRRIDDLVGEVLAALRESGAEGETLVVFAADHGEELYDHMNYLFHAYSLYGSVTRIPLILKQSDVLPANVRVPQIVESIDILPTLLARLGIEAVGDDARTRPRGADLGPVMRGEAPGRELAFAQVTDSSYSVRSRNWMFVRTDRKKREGQKRAPAPKRELYDLTADPGERTDVADRHGDVVAKMEKVLERWRAGLQPVNGKYQPMDAEARAELEALGYLGGK